MHMGGGRRKDRGRSHPRPEPLRPSPARSEQEVIMPTGPNGEKWPASPVACAVTGEKRGVVPPKRTPRFTPD